MKKRIEAKAPGKARSHRSPEAVAWVAEREEALKRLREIEKRMPIPTPLIKHVRWVTATDEGGFSTETLSEMPETMKEGVERGAQDPRAWSRVVRVTIEHFDRADIAFLIPVDSEEPKP